MILTFKISHNQDFSLEFKLARQVLDFALKHKSKSSKDVKHFGLKGVITNQLIRKYIFNKNTKTIRRIKLIIPNQAIKYTNNILYISCLKLKLEFKPYKNIIKINQIEIDSNFCYINCEISEENLIKSNNFIGVDLNSTGHCCVAANPKTGKIWKLGKKSQHIKKKYKSIRTKLQKQKRYKEIKKTGNRESRIIRDLNHKISNKIVKLAKEQNCGIKLENLKGIRKNTKGKKNLSFNLNNWSFYQLRTMIEYKAKLRGVQVFLIKPDYTSQICSKTGLLGKREGKLFKSPNGGVEHADVNAAFNIALKSV